MYDFLDADCPTGIEQVESPNYVALEEWVGPRYTSVDMSLGGEIDHNIGITYHPSAEARIGDVPLHKFVAWAFSQLVQVGGVAGWTHVVNINKLDLLPSSQNIPDEVASNEP